MESPFDQRTCVFYFLFVHVVALACVLENLLAHGDWAFDLGIDHSMIGVKRQVDYVEVVAPVYVPHNWDALYKNVGNCVTMALNDAVDGSCWQRVDKFCHLIVVCAFRLL